MNLVIAYGIGLLFGLGIAISGMANPAKVINFFDIAGLWDPSLAFVMGAALLVTGVGYRVVFKRQAPIMVPNFDLPRKTRIDLQLVAGAGVFGVGWGIAGFCPGGALPALGTMQIDVLVFVASLITGIWSVKYAQTRARSRARSGTPQTDG